MHEPVLLLCRLVSAYNEKLAGKNTMYQKSLGASILKQYQPHLSPEVKVKGQGVHFQVRMRG
jgi:hypothetical protein